MNASTSAPEQPLIRPRWWPFVLANTLLVLCGAVIFLADVILESARDYCYDLTYYFLYVFWTLFFSGYLLLPIGVALAKPSWRFCRQLCALIGLGFLYSLFIQAFGDGAFVPYSLLTTFILWLIGILLHQIFFLLITNLWIKAPFDFAPRSFLIISLMLIEGVILAVVMQMMFFLIESIGC